MRRPEATKHSLTLAGHRTSVSLEPEFWEVLRSICHTEGRSLSALIAEVDARRGSRNLSSALRVHILHRLTGRAG